MLAKSLLVSAAALYCGVSASSAAAGEAETAAFDFKSFVTAVFDGYDVTYLGGGTKLEQKVKVNATGEYTTFQLVIENQPGVYQDLYLWSIQFDENSNSTGVILEKQLLVSEEGHVEADAPAPGEWSELCKFNWHKIGPDGAVSSVLHNGVICTGAASNTADIQRAFATITLVDTNGSIIRTVKGTRRPLPVTKTFWQTYSSYVMMGGLVIAQIAVKIFAKSPAAQRYANSGRDAAAQRERQARTVNNAAPADEQEEEEEDKKEK